MSVVATSLTGPEILEAVAQGTTLVDFWAPWCGPCRGLAPVLDELAQEFAGRVRIVKVNTEEEPECTAHYGVSAVPALLLFRDGKLVERIIGAPSRQRLRDLLDGA